MKKVQTCARNGASSQIQTLANVRRSNLEHNPIPSPADAAGQEWRVKGAIDDRQSQTPDGVTPQEIAERKYPQISDGNGNILVPAMTGAQRLYLRELFRDQDLRTLTRGNDFLKWLDAMPLEIDPYEYFVPGTVELNLELNIWVRLKARSVQSGTPVAEIMREILTKHFDDKDSDLP